MFSAVFFWMRPLKRQPRKLGLFGEAHVMRIDELAKEFYNPQKTAH